MLARRPWRRVPQQGVLVGAVACIRAWRRSHRAQLWLDYLAAHPLPSLGVADDSELPRARLLG